MKSYGITKEIQEYSSDDLIVEQIARRGFAVVEDFLSEEACLKISRDLEEIYKVQEIEIGVNRLNLINELNVCRSPFMYNLELVDTITDDWILGICERMLQGPVILHLQNGVINRPAVDHHQTSWHRDLPYQEYTTSAPLAINVFICLSDFKEENGGTVLIPYSHHFDKIPSDNFIDQNSIVLEAKKGSVVLFDSFLYHRAGVNKSDSVRYGLNHVFTRPFIKQQIDYSVFESNNISESAKSVLGKDFRVMESVEEYRLSKLKKNE